MYAFLIFAFLIRVCVLADERLTVQRTGYGVNFDKVGHLLDAGGVAYYSHTWAIKIPRPVPPFGELLDCTGFDSTWLPICISTNDLVSTTNQGNYERVFRGNQLILNALDTVKKLENDPVCESSVVPSETATSNRRWKRELSEETKYTLENTLETVRSILPYQTEAQMVADFFDVPGPNALKQLKGNIKALGSLIDAEKDEVVRYSEHLTGVISTTNKRASAIEHEGTVLVKKLEAVNINMRAHHDQFADALDDITNQLQKINELVAMITMDLLPNLIDLKGVGEDLYDFARLWSQAVGHLASGYISETIVTVDMIQELLDYITETVLKTTKYSQFKIINTSPLFYYKLKRISYTRSDNHLFIVLDVPLYKIGGQIPLYRIDAFPVPVIAGLSTSSEDDLEDGYTHVLDLPGFLAVTEDTTFYLELEISTFLSCEEGSSSIKNCGLGLEALKSHAASITTCAYAIFTDNHDRVKQSCEIGYTKTIPLGSAVQLTSDNTFLIHGGEKKTNWVLSCPESAEAPTTLIPPCDMCRITIPCSCSLTAPDFFIPIRLTGCNKEFTAIPTTTKIYHRNMAMIQNVLNEDDLRGVRSFDSQVDALYPPLKVPKIEFYVHDDVPGYVEISDKYAADYNKAAQLSKENLDIFAAKVDEGLAEAKNFSDQIVDRTGDWGKAFTDLITGIFGGDVWVVASFIFGPAGLTFIAMLLNAILFVPELMTCMYERRQRAKEDSRKNEELAELLSTALQEDQNYCYTYSEPVDRVFVWSGSYWEVKKEEEKDTKC